MPVPVNWYATQNLSAVSQEIAFDNPANKTSSSNVSDRSLILNRPKPSSTLPAMNIAGVAEPYWQYNRPFALSKWSDVAAGKHCASDPKLYLEFAQPHHEQRTEVHV